MKLIYIISIVSFISFFVSTSYGQMYKWKDENGVWTFSNVMPPQEILDKVKLENEIEYTEPANKVDKTCNRNPSAHRFVKKSGKKNHKITAMNRYRAKKAAEKKKRNFTTGQDIRDFAKEMGNGGGVTRIVYR